MASSHKMNQHKYNNQQMGGQQTTNQTTYPSAGLIGATAGQHHHPSPNPTTINDAPTLRDVLNGRGQGVQRHPGNVKYRTLVFVNKVRLVVDSQIFMPAGVGFILCARPGRCIEIPPGRCIDI